MEDLKWLIRKYGWLFFLIVVVALMSCLIFNKNRNEKRVEEVWEPPIELSDIGSETENADNEEEIAESDSFKKQDCLITDAEKEELQNTALLAAEAVREVYKDIELNDNGLPYASNIIDFTSEQCRQVVRLLGETGVVSVADNFNMENGEAVKNFYASYLDKEDAMVTIFDVHQDGLIGAVTFIYREDRLQTYYVGVKWKEGGIPEIGNTLLSNIAEINLTEKGYFIYAYEVVIAHASLRQYWRVDPISDECRELTRKYISGLSYVNYNMLVTNWDSSNVGDILMPCMYEDIYRIHTGHILRTEGNEIPAEEYEDIMTTYFPVTKEQLKTNCGYDGESNTYPYDMIFAIPYPPFGEVVDYTYNSDGTITLIVDAVWADYNSDIAFTNCIVVQPLEDGTFRYLSNSIEKKELDIPVVNKK